MRLVAFVLVMMPLAVPSALAAPQDVANQISADVMSPFCPGLTLHDCPSDAAVALRERITKMAEAGYDRAAIMTELERDYGPTIRAVPDPRGSGLLAWLLPITVTIAAGATAWLLLRRWAREPAPVEGYDPDVHITPKDRRRIDHELAKLRGEA
ncbi:MAG TPA: cytochrome c-type biogenesis protein CcmH [Actinomycetota bacterium]|nr:cytochrome c-type biogenesis protein CcmH [Actinomycetota bacterium]